LYTQHFYIYLYIYLLTVDYHFHTLCLTDFIVFITLYCTVLYDCILSICFIKDDDDDDDDDDEILIPSHTETKKLSFR